jgi:hypothetical protein
MERKARRKSRSSSLGDEFHEENGLHLVFGKREFDGKISLRFRSSSLFVF